MKELDLDLNLCKGGERKGGEKTCKVSETYLCVSSWKKQFLGLGTKNSCSPIDLRSFVNLFLLPILSVSKCSSKIFIST